MGVVGQYAAGTLRRAMRSLRPSRGKTRSQQLYGLRSDAIVLHCPAPMRMPPNPFRHSWERALATFFSDETIAERFSDHEDLTILTYSTYDTPVLLERCLERLGLDKYVVVGADVATWQWIHKVSLVADYLESEAEQTEYMMCLDGDDVLVIGDPAVALQRFRDIGCEMLFCGTRGDQPRSPECWAFENSVPEYADPRHRHLNAGAYMGRTSFIRARLQEILSAHASGEEWCFSRYGFDDQLAWRHLHRRYYPQMKVDASCSVFLRYDEDR